MGKMSKWRRDKVAAPESESKGPMKMQVEQITPETARRWLAVNQSNRPISEDQVKRYAADMKNGNWKTTHQGISALNSARGR